MTNVQTKVPIQKVICDKNFLRIPIYALSINRAMIKDTQKAGMPIINIASIILSLIKIMLFYSYYYSFTGTVFNQLSANSSPIYMIIERKK